MISAMRWIRGCILVFMLGLVVAGVTAIPIQTEVNILASWVGQDSSSPLGAWILKAREGVVDGYGRNPFLAYGTDWLAFGHFAIALVFVGPLRDPVRNIWVIDFGIIACLLVVPFAIFFGGIRGIPFAWRLVDCSFGVMGLLPLLIARRLTRRIERGAYGTPAFSE